MHGIIFLELKTFIEAAAGTGAWVEIADRAGFDRRAPLASRAYPDEQLTALVEAACEYTGRPATDLLEEFGFHLAPNLLTAYRGFVGHRWTALDVLEHTETVIHRVVRLQNPEATPPSLRITRTGPDEAVIHYTSGRRLCALAKGLIRGVGTRYGEQLAIEETTCMHRGAAECTLLVRRVTD